VIPSEGDLHRRAEPQALLQGCFAPGEDGVFKGARGDRCCRAVAGVVTEMLRTNPVAATAFVVHGTEVGGTATAVVVVLHSAAEAADESTAVGTTGSVVPAGAATDPAVAAAAAAGAARVGRSGVCLCASGTWDLEAATLVETLDGDVHNLTEAVPLLFIATQPPLVTGLNVEATVAHGEDGGAEHGVANIGAVRLDLVDVNQQEAEDGVGESPCC